MNVNDISHFNSKDIPNQFGQYFSTTGNNMLSDIKQSHKQISNYISKIPNNNRTLFINPCTQNEISKLIDQLPNKTSSGYDEINNLLLKYTKTVPVGTLRIDFQYVHIEGECLQCYEACRSSPSLKTKTRQY